MTAAQLRKNRRYAIVACAAVAAFLPGDAITLLLETVPLYLLYEASILLASFAERRRPGRRRRIATGDPPSRRASPPAQTRAEPTVQQIIDHTDPRLSS